MDNVLAHKQKRCIEWSLRTPSSVGSTIVSETFLLQDQKCNLKFYTGHRNGSPPYLIFECNGEPHLPIEVTIYVVSNSITLANLNTSIASQSQYIWRCHAESEITDRRLIFELIFHAEYSRLENDKSVQTPSYIDNIFLMDGVSQDFSKMLSVGESSCHDLEFICGDQSIKAHKSVICSRSDVFASMLQSDMVEGKTGRVNIQDMDATIFRQFLGCIYTGVLPELTVDIALQFYEAGDKYNISSLKKQCADFLSDNLLLENAYDNLILADRHDDPDFKKNVMDFMIKEQLPYTGEKWTDFCKENPILTNEVLNLFCQHLRPK